MTVNSMRSVPPLPVPSVQLRERSLGLHRKADCGAVQIDEPGEFERRFEASTREGGTIVRVEWRVIPGRKPPQTPIVWTRAPKIANCGGVREDCRPCKRWRFDRVSFEVPSGSGDWGGSETALEITTPEGETRSFVANGNVRRSLGKKPIVAKDGDVVTFRAFERDLLFDDPLAAGAIQVKAFHRDGRAASGRLALEGVCEAS